jgi:TIR domain
LFAGLGNISVTHRIHLTRHREGINLSVEAHTKKTSIVIICNHKDEKWRTLLEEQLRVLEVDVWTDRDVGVGEDWHETIKDALRNASVAVLLISPDFLASDFVRKEEVAGLLERRDKEGFRIIPIIVGDVRGNMSNGWLECKSVHEMAARCRRRRELN